MNGDQDRFRIDFEWDRDRASNGRSRYEAYLLDRYDQTFAPMAADYDYEGGLTVPFAAACWRVARGPIMVPPFVLSPERVLSAWVERSNWDGEAVLNVEMAVDVPPVWRTAKTSVGKYFHGWPTSYSGRIEPVGDRDVADRPYMLTTTQVLFPLAPGTLPTVTAVPPRTGRALFDQAVTCVKAVVRIMNREIGPLLDQIDGKAAT